MTYIQTPPSLVFKETIPPSSLLKNVTLSMPFLLYFVALAVYISRSFAIGFAFALANIAFAIFTGLTILLLTPFVERISNSLTLPLRLSLKSLFRRPLGTITVMVSLTLGTTLLILLSHVEMGLQREMTPPEGAGAPSLFLIDIQDDQIASIESITKKYGVSLVGTSAMIKSKILSINGEKFLQEVDDKFTREGQKRQRMKNHSVNLTYRSKLGTSERVIEGEFSPKHLDVNNEVYNISLEKKYAKRIGAQMGDSIEFDIFGISIKTIVTSIRRIKWTSFLPNFFIVFPTGVLEDAPKTYLSTISKTSPEIKEHILGDLFKMAPNVSAIDISRSIEKIQKLILYLSGTLKIMALFSLIVGFIVLITITQNQIVRRENELNFLKIIGLGHREVSFMIYSEILLMTIISGLLGTVLGALASWPILNFFFDAPFLFLPWHGPLLTATLSILSLCLAWFGSRKLARSKAQKLLEEFEISY